MNGSGPGMGTPPWSSAPGLRSLLPWITSASLSWTRSRRAAINQKTSPATTPGTWPNTAACSTTPFWCWGRLPPRWRPCTRPGAAPTTSLNCAAVTIKRNCPRWSLPTCGTSCGRATSPLSAAPSAGSWRSTWNGESSPSCFSTAGGPAAWFPAESAAKCPSAPAVPSS